ncbi:hypothetical protein BH20ACT5_BH20ACT5_23100 [soil metagenome]
MIKNRVLTGAVALALAASVAPTQAGAAEASSAGQLLRTLQSPDPQSGSSFARPVASVANTNGGGDILVGARNENSADGRPAAGRAHLYDGATGALLHTLESPNPQGRGFFGRAVSGVPDVDGDGFGDLLIGAPGEDSGGMPNAGRAYLFSGKTGRPLGTLQAPNPQKDARFGSSVSGVDDLDGLRGGDLLVGANREGQALPEAGSVYVFSGAAPYNLIHTLVSPNPVQSGVFGASLANVGDVNADGRGDFLVGAFKENGGAQGSGRAYVYSGADGMLIHSLQSPKAQADGNFARSVSGIPDVDGDGVGDLFVGAGGEDVGAARLAGRAYVFSGRKDKGTLIHTLESPSFQQGGHFGFGVAGVPDVDGDGRGDLLVGAYGEGDGAPLVGRAHLFSSKDKAPLIRTLESPNPQAGGYFGATVAGVPDVDGDRRGDLLIGAPSEAVGTVVDAGRAHLFSGGTGSGLTVTASGDPTTIAAGGTVRVTALVSNTTAAPASLDLWIVAERNGKAVQTKRVTTLTVPANGSETVLFNLSAPRNTPPDVYTINVNVGTFPGVVLATDAFPLTVTGRTASVTSAPEPFVVSLLPGEVFATTG